MGLYMLLSPSMRIVDPCGILQRSEVVQFIATCYNMYHYNILLLI